LTKRYGLWSNIEKFEHLRGQRCSVARTRVDVEEDADGEAAVGTPHADGDACSTVGAPGARAHHGSSAVLVAL
jgi:hypothetical protein